MEEAEFVVFDKAKWHYQGEFPEDLDDGQAFVHAGLFLGWVIEAGLYSEEFADDFEEEIEQFKARKLTGPGVYRVADGVFASDMLGEEGVAFARAYYDREDGGYLDDFESLLAGGLPTMYHVRDTWENYDRLKATIDERFAAWRGGRGSR